MKNLLPVLLLLIFASPASAKLLANFNFEKGDISEWSAGPNNIYTDHAVTVVTDPVRSGRNTLVWVLDFSSG